MVWKVLLWLVLFALGSTIGGIVGAVVTPECQAQSAQVVIDTSTTQYQRDTLRVDSIVQGMVMWYVNVLRFPGWRITVRADSVPEGMVAQTFVREEYRVAMVVIDFDRAAPWMLEEIVAHELCHAKVAPLVTTARSIAGGHLILADQLRLAEERFCTDASRAMVWRAH